nr:immunoglobulin light chain junction region [Macaca mulatta]MOW60634.1 immunoglobulin light chain junction region [Macaca mulatta]MOX78429.1 immunoglobulin light chain junction region [Macaca mulatta]MOX78563.1 immunoglobulin light chain junction region [Macaca mulatta]MOX80043.1 immunoglobulin light chain junction region [Macaca mulatta]
DYYCMIWHNNAYIF